MGMDLFKRFSSSKKQSLPLKPTLVFTVVFAISLTALGIGLPIYLTSTQSIRSLWDNLGDQIGASSAARSLRYLHNAINFENYWVLQTEKGEIDINNNQKLLDLEYAAIKSSRFFNWVSFSKTDGTYTSSYRIPNDNNNYGTLRTIDNNALDKTKATHVIDYLYQNNQWVVIKEYYDDYDPRLRPFWIKAIENPSGAWTDPYKLKLYNEPAIAYARPQYLNNELVGVWSVEFDAGELNAFLNSLKSKFGGDVLFIANDGTIVASSIGEFYNTQVNSPEFEKILRDENDIVQDIWEQSLKEKNRITDLNENGFFAHIEPFFTGEIPWHVITIIPEEKFLGPLRKQMVLTILSGLLLCILFAFLAAIFFGHISKRLKTIAEEMDRIGNFKFSNTLFSDKPSFVKEVTLMNIATDRMKIGLNSFSKYVPVNLVRELIKSGQPAQLSAKKTLMTVLFSDLINFTTLSEKTAPEMLVDILGQYLEIMSQSIQKANGEVDKFIGDSIMAIFGAPIAIKNHAQQACIAALEMKEKLESLNKHWADEKKIFLEQKIGINTGNMIVGNIGASNRFEYTVIGDSVNLASRLEGLNKFYGTQILIGEDTAKLVADDFLLRPLDFVTVKGKEMPHLIFELIGFKKDKTDTIEEVIKKSKEALMFYRNKEFAKALELFNECNEKLLNNDFASKVMAEKCRKFMIDPPPSNWAGVTVMSEK